MQEKSYPISCNRPLKNKLILACPQCDMLQRIPNSSIKNNVSIRCPRCNQELWRYRKDTLNRTLALTVAALVFYIIANSSPILGLNAVGNEAFTTILGGVVQLWGNNQKIVAVLVLFVAVIAPLLQIAFQLLILLGSLKRKPKRWVGILLRNLNYTRTWSMLEVMLLGVLIALTKIADYASVITGASLFSLFALVFLLAAIQLTFDPHEVWKRISWVQPEKQNAIETKYCAGEKV